MNVGYFDTSFYRDADQASDISEVDSNAIAHFGVKGMKWGVRKQRKSSRDAESDFVRSVKRKPISKMSNAELRRASSRLQLEVNYSSLKKQRASQRFGHKLIRKIGKQAGDKLTSSITDKVVSKGMVFAQAGLDKLVHKT